jgi:hemoglobin
LNALFSKTLYLQKSKPIRQVIKMEATLYERLGGYNGISAVVDSLFERMTKDQRLTKYFRGHGEDSSRRLRQLQKLMICQSTGGSCFYLGRDMKTVHKGMGIDEADWQAMVTHLIGVLNSFKVPDADQKAVLEMLNGKKKDIVEKP